LRRIIVLGRARLGASSGPKLQARKLSDWSKASFSWLFRDRGGNFEMFYLTLVAYKYTFFVFRLSSVGDPVCAMKKELYLDISMLFSSFRLCDLGPGINMSPLESSDC